MKKANLVAVLFGTAVVAGGGLYLVGKKKKEETPAKAELPPGTSGVAAVPGSVAMQYPTYDTALQSRVMTAVSSNNPAVMRTEAAKLRAEGHTDAGNSLDAYASSVETNAAVVQGAMQNVANVLAQPVASQSTTTSQSTPQVPQVPAVALPPAVTPQPTSPTPAQPLPTTPPTTDIQLPGMTGPVQVPSNVMTQAGQALPSLISTMTSAPAITTGSPAWPEASDPAKMAVATAMNLNIASSAKGKENKTLVKQFQTQEAGGAGKVDGLYGPTVAKRLATQYGIIPPTPLYWSSKTPVANQKGDYAMWLSEMAEQDPVRLEQWNAAAAMATK